MNIYNIFETKKGLYYNVNQRKKAGTSRSKNAPEAPSAADWKNAAKTAKEDINEGIEIVYELSEGAGQQLSVQQLAAISDTALDSAYGYGRSSPGNTFGWQANLASAAYAKQMIDRGETDVEAISDAVHKGWWSVAQKFVDNPDQFSDTEKLRANGKFDKKMADRKAQMVPFNQLTKDQQDIDTVVARAMLQAIKGQQGVEEGYDDEPEECWTCRGTGEGQFDGQSCSVCHGSGVEPRQHDDDDFDVPDDYYEDGDAWTKGGDSTTFGNGSGNAWTGGSGDAGGGGAMTNLMGETTNRPYIRKVKYERADGTVEVTYELLDGDGKTIKTGMSKEIAMSVLKHYRANRVSESIEQQRLAAMQRAGYFD